MRKTVVGVWGKGFVGTATGHVFEALCPDKVEVLYYDKYKECNATPKELLDRSEFVFICLPTPMKITGEVSLEYIETSLKDIKKILDDLGRKESPIFIIRSTSVSGSTDFFAGMFCPMRFVFCPEFLREAHHLHDALNPDRIVIGANHRQDREEVHNLFYKAFGETVHYIFLSRKEAETLKYFANAHRFVQIMLSNDLYFMCQKIGVDYDRVIEALKFDRAVGTFTKVPGHDGDYGAGGKCLIKDTNALLFLSQKAGYFPCMLDTAIRLNDHVRRTKDWLEIPGAVEDCGYEERRK